MTSEDTRMTSNSNENHKPTGYNENTLDLIELKWQINCIFKLMKNYDCAQYIKSLSKCDQLKQLGNDALRSKKLHLALAYYNEVSHLFTLFLHVSPCVWFPGRREENRSTRRIQVKCHVCLLIPLISGTRWTFISGVLVAMSTDAIVRHTGKKKKATATQQITGETRVSVYLLCVTRKHAEESAIWFSSPTRYSIAALPSHRLRERCHFSSIILPVSTSSSTLVILYSSISLGPSHRVSSPSLFLPSAGPESMPKSQRRNIEWP